MGALGWRMVSHAFWTLTSWISFRDIFLFLYLKPKVDTSLETGKDC